MSTNDPTSRPDHDPSATTGDGHIRPANAADSAGEDESETFRPDWSAAIARLRGWVGSVRERLSRTVARGSRGMLAVSLAVGAGAGLGAVAFRYMILGFTYAFTGHRDYSAAGHATNPLLPGLGIWFVVLAPVIGGLIYGPLVSRFAPEARGGERYAAAHRAPAENDLFRDARFLRRSASARPDELCQQRNCEHPGHPDRDEGDEDRCRIYKRLFNGQTARDVWEL